MGTMRAHIGREIEGYSPLPGSKPPGQSGTPNLFSLTSKCSDGSFGPYRRVRGGRSRPKVERYLAVDIRRLQDYGLLEPSTEGTVQVRSADGRQFATAAFLFAASKLRVKLEGITCSVPTEIRIERTPCPRGGTRPWFRCRRCNSRRSILYGLDEDNSFSCRRCMGLVFSSQDETKMKRLWRKQRRLEAKLTGKYRVARPKGMHRSTHMRILSDLNSVLVKQNHLHAVSARKLLDRIGWPPGHRP